MTKRQLSLTDNCRCILSTAKMNENDEDNDIVGLLEGIINEEDIFKAANTRNLNELSTLKLQIDTNAQSILNICDLVPNLRTLVLDKSIVTSIRDLGVSYTLLI